MRAQLLALALLFAAQPAFACTDKDPMGCSVQQNIATQVIDMNPTYAGTLMEGGVGQRTTAAVNRYMTDKIRPLVRADLRSEVGLQGGAAASKDPTSTGAPK